MITAVEAERDAILRALPETTTVRVVAGGVGPAAAAAATARELAAAPNVELVVSAGIGGGFAPLAIGDVAVATACVFADLGADSPDGFLPVSGIGMGSERHEVAAKLAVELADRTGGHLGCVLTVATVTGTSARAEELGRRHPDAVADAMEGAGVATAAEQAGVAFAEIRAISNMVGPRDRSGWRIAEALDALGHAVAASVTEVVS